MSLNEVIKITEIRLSLLKILQSIQDDECYSKEDAAQEVVKLINQIDQVHYTIHSGGD